MGVKTGWKIETWHGAYEGGWKSLIVDEAFAHPAKAARKLLERIFETLGELGALKKGDVVLDPFGGVGTTALIGASRGYQVVCVELEEKFVRLARENVELHRPAWEALGRPLPVILQGDSRRLRDVLAAAGVACIVASPPYVSGGHHPDQTGAWNTNGCGQNGRGLGSREAAGYGTSDGQLGQMREGDLDAVIASPPFAGVTHGTNGSWRQLRELWNANPENAGKPGYRPKQTGDYDCPSTQDTYGASEGQIANLPEGSLDAVVSSPPYAEIAAGAGGLNTKPAKDGQQGGRSAESPSQQADQRYGASDGQLARLPAGEVDAVVGSPPFLDARSHLSDKGCIKGSTPTTHDPESMGTLEGNLSAMRAGDVDAIVSSPPFPQPYTGGGGINVKGYGADGADKVGDRTYQGRGGERADGNLETLPTGDVEAVVSSPPYEGSLAASSEGVNWEEAKRETEGGGEHQAPGASAAAAHPKNPDNIGNRTGETFWSAAHKIVRESYALLKPGGYAAWIVKRFVRDGRIQPFDDDWRRLCEHVGFETVIEARAMLVQEERRPDLFDGEVVTRKARKSFFRRLYESKHPQNAIDWETVWIMRKPL